MGQAFLFDVELYYSRLVDERSSEIVLDDTEFKHAVKVMRNNVGDTLFVTDGLGKIYKTTITGIKSKMLISEIEAIYEYEKSLPNVNFVIPRLKSADRFEFALEKCTELGVTKFNIFNAERSVAKGEKSERWRKVLLAAMKQSLRAYLPEISFKKDLKVLNKEGNVIYIFDQNADLLFKEVVENIKTDDENEHYFIFGPEGGLTENEIKLFPNAVKVKLTGNRLRAETAVISAAAALGI